jgi:hypothetical protein
MMRRFGSTANAIALGVIRSAGMLPPAHSGRHSHG